MNYEEDLKMSPGYALYNNIHLLDRGSATPDEVSELNKLVLKYNVQEVYTNEQILELYKNGSAKEMNNTFRKISDIKARELGFDSALDLCSYASFQNPYQQSSQRFVKWRGDSKSYVDNEIAKIKSGQRQRPNIEQLLNELPTLNI